MDGRSLKVLIHFNLTNFCNSRFLYNQESKIWKRFCSVPLSEFLDTFEEVKANEQVGQQIISWYPKITLFCLHHLPLIFKDNIILVCASHICHVVPHQPPPTLITCVTRIAQYIVESILPFFHQMFPKVRGRVRGALVKVNCKWSQRLTQL